MAAAGSPSGSPISRATCTPSTTTSATNVSSTVAGRRAWLRLASHLVGFGTGFVDVDNDGWEDLVIANGHVLQHPILGSPVKQLALLLRNVEFEGRRFYRDLGPSAGPYFTLPKMGAAWPSAI